MMQWQTAPAAAAATIKDMKIDCALEGEKMKLGNREKRKKIIVTTVSAMLLSLLYVMIFCFSAQDGEQSGSLSHLISERCVEIVNALSGKHWSEVMMAEFAAYFEHPIRKMAHFTEYACMGALVYNLWRSWVERGRRLYLLSVAWVFLSAAADEFHQLFVPGRWGSFADVCLDTLGGACGVLLCALASRIYRVALRR